MCQCISGSLNCTDYGCHENAECSVRNGVRDCYCIAGYRGNGQTCVKGKLVDEYIHSWG